MNNNYIKLNNSLDHLSLGNLFNSIKSISINKSSAIQTEIFCAIFEIDNISDTTVNNYCTGYRAIGNNYKQIYLNYQKHYRKDKNYLIKIINNLLSIIDGYLYSYNTIQELNGNHSLKKLCEHMHTYAKNDYYVTTNLKKELLLLLNKKQYYEYICEVLFFVILEKKQPLYNKDLVNETIDEILEHTNISINDLKNYLYIGFKEGISYIPSLKKLANENNPYALYELGNLEYNGLITGYPRYDIAYNYHLKAASYNHPTSCWMIAHMIINKKIGSLTPSDIDLAWSYLEKAQKLNSISSLNTIGLCYLHGYTKDKKQDITTAIKYFEKAARKNYIYAYNNLGKIYEERKDYEKAFEYYLKSANEEESWACNKVGLYYYNGIYVEKDLAKAFEYFKKGANAPIKNRIPWNIYNLVYLFYMSGNTVLGIEKDLVKSIELLETIEQLDSAKELLLYCYYELYLESKSNTYLNKVKYYLDTANKIFDKKKKIAIENTLKDIYSYHIDINL